MLWAALALGLTLPTAPGAVSFAPGLLKPIPAAEGVLRRLRSAGTAHLAAVAMYQEDVEADLLKGGDLLDVLLTTTATAEPSASPEIVKALGAKDWVHVCGTVKELAAAKRVGARTLWLNAAAAADEHSKTFSDEEIERAQATGLAEPRDQAIQLIKRSIGEPDFAADAFGIDFSFQAKGIRQFSLKGQCIRIFRRDGCRFRRLRFSLAADQCFRSAHVQAILDHRCRKIGRVFCT